MPKRLAPRESTASSARARSNAAEETIVTHAAEIDGLKLHYTTAGRGTPLILLHGYAETSLMCAGWAYFVSSSKPQRI